MGAFEDAADKLAAERQAGSIRSRELAARKESVVEEFLAKVSSAGIRPIPLGVRGRQVIKRKGLFRQTGHIRDEYIEFKNGWVIEPGLNDRERDVEPVIVSTEGDLFGWPNRGNLWARPGDKWIGAPEGPFYAFESSSEPPQPKLYLHESAADQMIRLMVSYIDSNR